MRETVQVRIPVRLYENLKDVAEILGVGRSALATLILAHELRVRGEIQKVAGIEKKDVDNCERDM